MARGKFKRNNRFRHKNNHPSKKKRRVEIEGDSKFSKYKQRNNSDETNAVESKSDSQHDAKLLEDSSSEEDDDYQKLLSTLTGGGKLRKNAIDSEYETSESDSAVDEQNPVVSEKEQESSDDECKSVLDVKDVYEEQEDSGDPFVGHLKFDLDSALLDAISNEPPKLQTSNIKWPILGNLVVKLPNVLAEKNELELIKTKVSIEEKKEFAKCGTVPKIIENVDWDKLFIKSQLANNLSKANFMNLGNTCGKRGHTLTEFQKELFSIVYSYQDLYFPERNFKNSEEIRFVYCLHAVNHILKTRTRIIHHNSKLSKRTDVPDEFRDQGLVRPKVLILVPFRESALRIVKLIISIILPDDKANVGNKSRFNNEFTGSEIALPKKNPKPEDYELTFTGNTDDNFRIGMNITKKSLKLYTDFYSSDIIVASPLGLRTIIGAEGETERDYDFLASIELLILDQTEIFLMQNWDHLLHVFNHLHLQPRDSHGADFSRIRSWAVNGWTRYYRQTLIFSSVHLPEFNSLFGKRCRNYAGSVSVTNPVSLGAVCTVLVQVPQVFNKFHAPNPVGSIDSRFDYFVSKILPQYKDSMMTHTLIYVPSYFDFVRLRNYFKKEDINFVQICEYSKDNKIARARDMFFHSDSHFLLYSERFHFFRRLRLKGIRHIIFYQMPTFPHFYSEMCNLMQEGNQNPKGGNDSNMTITAIYSKFDALQLSAIVGFDRASRMISSEKHVHMFMSGQ